MNVMKSVALAALSAVMVVVADPAFAHSMLKSSSITEGAVLTAQPKHIVLTFKHEVGLSSIGLTDSVGEKVAMSYSPPKAMSLTFDVPLPALRSDSYKLSWRAIASDGHVMTGEVNFSVAIVGQ